MLHSNTKIKELEADGFVVNVHHVRKLTNTIDGEEFYAMLYHPEEIKAAVSDGWTLSPTNGFTVVDILDKEGNNVATAAAYCNDTDNFSRTIGRDIALGRALKEWSR